MTRSPFMRATILAAFSIVASAGEPAAAQSVAEFYTGRQMILIVGSPPGDGYDTTGRIVARYMGKYLPGQPKFIVQNMTGAGGITAANYANTIATKDGSTIVVVNREAIFDPVFSGDATKANYDSRKFVWLGTPNQEVGMAYVMSDRGAKTIEDARRRELIIAGNAPTSGSSVMPRLLNALIGTKFKIVTGYGSSMDALLAMQNGEADARVTSGWTGPETTAAMDLQRRGKINLLLQIGVAKDSRYPDLQSIMEFAKTDEDRRLMELLFIGQSLGRPFFAPPGVPADRAAALQSAFMRTMDDPEFRKDAGDQEINVSPLFGPEMLKIVEGLYATPKPLLQKAIDMSAAAQK
jgi:tripartite-type tricarboxylate transporter receptor subunit TctC